MENDLNKKVVYIITKNGDMGPVGPKGEDGKDSVVPGPVGPKGDTGPQGPHGPVGPQGVTGKDGVDSTVPGPKGDKGDKGDDGSPDSPTEIVQKLRKVNGSWLKMDAVEGLPEAIAKPANNFYDKRIESLVDVDLSGTTKVNGKYVIGGTDTDEKVKLSASDPTAGYLDAKLNEGVTGVKAVDSSGFHIKGSGGDTAVLVGAGGGKNVTFYDGVKLDAATSSKVVFTDANKNLTNTGIGTSAQFIKGDGSLDSSTYLTAEADTLQTVTTRGASTATSISLTGGASLTADGNLIGSNVASRLALGTSVLSRVGIYGAQTFTDLNTAVYGMNFSNVITQNNTSYTGQYFQISLNTGVTVGTVKGLNIVAPVLNGTAAITTNYGLYIDSITQGTTNYAIYSAGGLSYLKGALHLNMPGSVIDSAIPLWVYTGIAAGANKGMVLAGGGQSTTSGPALSLYQTWGNTINNWEVGRITGLYTSGSYGGALVFSTNKGTTTSDMSEKMRIDQSGKLKITGPIFPYADSTTAMQFFKADGTTAVVTIDTTNSRFGVGVTPAAKAHFLATTEQLRLGYDASNYLSATVGSTGSTTFALTGTTPIFTFSQAVKFSGGTQSSDGSAGLSATYNIDGSAAGTVATMTFKNGLLTAVTTR